MKDWPTVEITHPKGDKEICQLAHREGDTCTVRLVRKAKDCPTAFGIKPHTFFYQDINQAYVRYV